MTFAVTVKYNHAPDAIASVRPTHRQYCADQMKEGHYVVGGPFPDDSGALIVYEAESKEQVDSIMRNDPFCQAGVFASWEIQPWKIVMANSKLLPV